MTPHARQVARVRNRRWRARHPEYHPVRDWSAHYAKRRARGLCQRCPNRSERFALCVECRLKKAERRAHPTAQDRRVAA